MPRASGCDDAPKVTSSSTVGGATVSVTLDKSVSAEMAVDVNGYQVIAEMNLGSECDGFKAPSCPTAAGVVDGTDRNGYSISLTVLHGADVESHTSVSLASRMKLQGNVADDAKLDTLEIQDKVQYAFAAKGTSAAATIRRVALYDMRKEFWLPEGAAVNMSYLQHGGADLGPAARADLRDSLARDYDKSFPQIVDKEVKNYRNLEKAWQEPNTCATLAFAAASKTLTLQEGQTGQFTATMVAKQDGGHAKALADLSGQANATFTPAHAEGDPATFGYTVTAAGGGKQVTATVRATSKAGVAKDDWIQNTFKPVPAPPGYSGPISGTAKYDEGVNATWTGSIVIVQAPNNYPPGYPGAPAASYQLSSGSVQYSFSGTLGDCAVSGGGTIDLGSQPDLHGPGLLTLYDGAPRTYRLYLPMPATATVPGTKSGCSSSGPFDWPVATGAALMEDAPLPGGPVGEDWRLHGTGAGTNGGGAPDETYKWDLTPSSP